MKKCLKAFSLWSIYFWTLIQLSATYLSLSPPAGKVANGTQRMEQQDDSDWSWAAMSLEGALQDHWKDGLERDGLWGGEWTLLGVLQVFGKDDSKAQQNWSTKKSGQVSYGPHTYWDGPFHRQDMWSNEMDENQVERHGLRHSSAWVLQGSFEDLEGTSWRQREKESSGAIKQFSISPKQSSSSTSSKRRTSSNRHQRYLWIGCQNCHWVSWPGHEQWWVHLRDVRSGLGWFTFNFSQSRSQQTKM